MILRSVANDDDKRGGGSLRLPVNDVNGQQGSSFVILMCLKTSLWVYF